MPKSKSSKKPSKTPGRPTSRSPSPSTATPSNAAKRLLHELSDNAAHPNPALLHLGPISDDNLLEWEAVLKGPAPNSSSSSTSTSSASAAASTSPSPYTNGLWLLSITIPTTYPRNPPTLTFLTPICHPNISISTGEICLSLLTTEHWTPMYTISTTLGAVQQLLVDPVSESPLNVDLANLYREGDVVGAESLVRFWTAERRWKGEGRGGWISQARPGSGGKLDE